MNDSKDRRNKIYKSKEEVLDYLKNANLEEITLDKAEQRALEKYPPQTIHFTNRYSKRVQSVKVDAHAPARKIYIKGYHQGREDSKLTKEDIIKIRDLIVTSEFKNAITNYEEVANKFNNSRINN